jgi:hypothetical protein
MQEGPRANGARRTGMHVGSSAQPCVKQWSRRFKRPTMCDAVEQKVLPTCGVAADPRFVEIDATRHLLAVRLVVLMVLTCGVTAHLLVAARATPPEVLVLEPTPVLGALEHLLPYERRARAATATCGGSDTAARRHV